MDAGRRQAAGKRERTDKLDRCGSQQATASRPEMRERERERGIDIRNKQVLRDADTYIYIYTYFGLRPLPSAPDPCALL